MLSAHGASVDRAAGDAFARAADADISCQGSAQADVSASMSFGTSLDLKGNWSLFHGLQSASLTANAHASASISASAAAAGSCTLDSTPIVKFHGPSATVFVGPVPVVLDSVVTVDLDAAASVGAKLTTNMGGGFDAQAGIGWKKKGGFYPIQTFSPSFSFTPPTLSAGASVEANLTPNIDVLVYGIAGPQLALKAGLNLSADIQQNPWWTLTAPVDLSGKLDVPVLKLSSPSLHLYRHTFTLARATTSAPGTSTTTPTPVAGGPGGGGGTGGAGPFTTFDGGPGTDAPPATLGPYAMQPFPADSSDLGSDVSSLAGPTGAISFDNPLTHDQVANGWQTWSNGYTGDVYDNDQAADDGQFETTITLPPGTGAFYLYAEPDIFEDFAMSATSDDGTTSGATTVFGDSGAQYFGFYAACGHSIKSIEVTDDGTDDAMAIGEFGIAPASSCSSAAPTVRGHIAARSGLGSTSRLAAPGLGLGGPAGRAGENAPSSASRSVSR